MKAFLFFLTLVTGVAFAGDTSCPEAATETSISFEALDVCLQNQGVEVEVHGIVPMSSMFVVTFRNPENFFQSVHMSLLANTPELRGFIRTLKRHDVIVVKGQMHKIPAPQKHIMSNDITVVYRNPQPVTDEYKYEALPEHIMSMKNFIGKVHAVFGDGRILVLEYKDYVVPVYVDDSQLELTKNLARADKIEINYVVQPGPRRPVHVNLDLSHPTPLKVLHAIGGNHGKPMTMTGKLVRFSKSPMLKFPVFAIDIDMGDGVMVQHTVLSFTDVDLFTKIREKFQAAWDRHPESVRNSRNKFVNDALTVTVTGTYNMIDPLQANPQLVVDDLANITIAE